MLTALDKKGNRIPGWKARTEEAYYCPECKEHVVLKKGAIKVYHFAHIQESSCQYSTGETELHLRMKRFLCEKFIESCLYKKIELEYKIDKCIADLYLQDKQDREVAIECQVSPLDIDDFRKKTAYYSYRNIYSLWIFSGNKKMDECLPKLAHNYGAKLNYLADEVERKCHRWFYGRIYYFYNDKIYAVHFHPIEKWIPSSCEECRDDIRCPYSDRAKCPKYKPGHFRRPKALREISIHLIIPSRLVCVQRKDRMKIAGFGESNWWKA